MDRDSDLFWKAMSNATRRSIIEQLRCGPLTTTEIVECIPQLSRFAVMKHIDVLRKIGLVTSVSNGRRRIHSLNTELIRQVIEHYLVGMNTKIDRLNDSSASGAARVRKARITETG